MGPLGLAYRSARWGAFGGLIRRLVNGAHHPVRSRCSFFAARSARVQRASRGPTALAPKPRSPWVRGPRLLWRTLRPVLTAALLACLSSYLRALTVDVCSLCTTDLNRFETTASGLGRIILSGCSRTHCPPGIAISRWAREDADGAVC